MTTADAVIRELTRQLGRPSAQAAVHARYIGAQKHEDRKADEQSRLRYWGKTVPQQRALRVELTDLSPEEQWKLWLQVWNKSDIYEIRSAALMHLTHKKQKEIRHERIQDLMKLAADIDNWAHSDTLSSALAEALEENSSLLKQYLTWNRSENAWLRRQSIVGLYCYARQRKKHLPARQALKLIEALLDDPHFYVQRGVGWALREVDRVDSELQRAFVRKHLSRISGVAWFATSELYPVKLKKELVQKRKEARGTPSTKRLKR